MSIVRKEKFIFVESAENHNKFWYIEEHDNGLIKTIWGRVGNKESTSEKQFGSNAGKEYDKLVKSKLKKGYTRLQTLDSEITFTSGGGISKQSLESIALSEIDYDKANDTITKMIKTFCAENIHTITANTSITFNSDTNVFQTPCGIVTIESINDARDILSEIAVFVEQRDICATFIKKTEEYCTLIPQKIKGKFDPCSLFFNMHDVNRQSDILDSLEDSIKIINDLKESDPDKKTKMFNTSIKEVVDSEVINQIKKLYQKTHQNTHACRGLTVKRVFEINIDHMNTAYSALRTEWTDKKKRKNTKSLWHGTKKSNIISILKNGFIIPPSNAKHVVGRMFGNGIYFSDQSTKALNYAYGWWSGSRDSNCYMFLCDVMLGTSYTPSGSCSAIPNGYDSIFAKAGKSGVQNNEMIVMPNQVNPKYLIEFGE